MQDTRPEEENVEIEHVPQGRLGQSTGFRDDVAADAVLSVMEDASVSNTSGFRVSEPHASEAIEASSEALAVADPMKVSSSPLSKEEGQELQATLEETLGLFKTLDTNNDNVVSKIEVLKGLKKSEIVRQFFGLPAKIPQEDTVNRRRLEDIFQSIDADLSKSLTWEELERWIREKHSERCRSRERDQTGPHSEEPDSHAAERTGPPQKDRTVPRNVPHDGRETDSPAAERTGAPKLAIGMGEADDAADDGAAVDAAFAEEKKLAPEDIRHTEGVPRGDPVTLQPGRASHEASPARSDPAQQASPARRDPAQQASPARRDPAQQEQQRRQQQQAAGSSPSGRRQRQPGVSTSPTAQADSSWNQTSTGSLPRANSSWNQTSTSSLPRSKSTGSLLRETSRTFCSSYGPSPTAQGGVLKRSPFLTSLSSFRSQPKYTFSTRGSMAFPLVTSDAPGPGSYNLSEVGKTSKFRQNMGVSVPASSRFGFRENPAKKRPAPGDYEPRNPLHHTARKVGFSTAPRGRPGVRSEGPGPGSYEMRNMDPGPAFKQKGKSIREYAPTRAFPGPGHYDPSDNGTSQCRGDVKVGFGTSAREDFVAKHQTPAPGPGLYDVDKHTLIGKNSAKFSILSRPRDPKNFETYLTPAPGWYDNHATSFGY